MSEDKDNTKNNTNNNGNINNNNNNINNNINNIMWKSQYQNYNQAQSMINFLQFQQIMMENMAKFGGANQLNNIQGLQGGANNNSNNPPQPKEEYINICFSTVKGSRILMKVKPDETVEKVLEKYLLRVELPDLINKIDGKINFIFSAQSLKFGDKRKIKDVMIIGGGLNQILVNDTKDLIGAFQNNIFKLFFYKNYKKNFFIYF